MSKLEKYEKAQWRQRRQNRNRQWDWRVKNRRDYIQYPIGYDYNDFERIGLNNLHSPNLLTVIVRVATF